LFVKIKSKKVKTQNSKYQWNKVFVYPDNISIDGVAVFLKIAGDAEQIRSAS